MSGRLVLVGTPIGNLDDLSARTVKALAAADVIYCEDTRRARKLLAAVGLPAPRLLRLDQHNEGEMSPRVVDAIEGGLTAVLVTDAGMPTISDPGSIVVRAVADAGLAVEVVPGPTAVSVALAVSGLPGSRYRFAGFLPRKGRERSELLAALAEEPETSVIYESPHRVARTISDLCEACGTDRYVVAARELTKLHEEVWRGTLGDAVAWLESAADPPRGEWVLVLAGTPAGSGASEVSDGEIAIALTNRMGAGADRRQAVVEVAAELGLPKRRVYAVSVSPLPASGG
jgi:16S rRNA (cytidine1402-2'-O)-methyltransferase